MSNMRNNNDELSFLECVKVLGITFIGISAPSLLIGYILKLITSLNLIMGTIIGLVVVLAIGFALGFHKPASANEYKEEDDDEDDD